MSRQHVVVGLVQFTATTDKPGNVATAFRLVRAAAEQGAELVLLPEMFPYIGPAGTYGSVAEPLDGPLGQQLSRLARELGIWLLAGTVPEQSEEPPKVWNTQVLYDDTGAQAAVYRKMHLFDVAVAAGAVFKESDSFLAGTEVVVADTPWGGLGLATCYDLRFPEMFRKLVEGGARLFTLPAAFTLYTGKDHWEVLLRARAIENQCFVLACGHWGKHSKSRQSFGASMAIDPWGTVLARAPEREAVVVSRLELSDLDRIRSEMPCLNHRCL